MFQYVLAVLFVIKLSKISINHALSKLEAQTSRVERKGLNLNVVFVNSIQ